MATYGTRNPLPNSRDYAERLLDGLWRGVAIEAERITKLVEEKDGGALPVEASNMAHFSSEIMYYDGVLAAFDKSAKKSGNSAGFIRVLSGELHRLEGAMTPPASASTFHATLLAEIADYLI